MEVLIPVIQALAPTVAKLLSGPLGKPLLTLLASMLGSRLDPTSVAKAIPADPSAVEKLKALEAMLAAHEAEDMLTKESIDLVAQAYAKELGKGFFWSGLRPAAGWVMVGLSTVYTGIALKAAALGSYVPMDHVAGFLAVLSPLAAVTGVYFWQRTTEKTAVLEAIKPKTKG